MTRANRTTELLCKLLEERGIEWKDGDASYEIEWSTPDGRHCSAMYWKPTLTVLISGCTPEQAIAATLGSTSATVDDVLSLLDEMNEQGRIEYADYSQLHDAIATTLGDGEYESRMDELLCRLTNGKWSKSRSYSVDFMVECIDEAYEDAALGGGGFEINGETSDGYHTFNELYHHRAVLFSVVVANHREIAWKSKLHHDGTMYDGMFIVGVDTPQGQATYHYDVEPYWDMFWCKELERAPEWDGHTPEQAIERIGSLRDVVLKGSRGRRWSDEPSGIRYADQAAPCGKSDWR